jgi:hypothetical protein
MFVRFAFDPKVSWKIIDAHLAIENELMVRTRSPVP